MKNLNNIISRLSGSGLLSGMSGGAPKAVSQRGALDAIGGIAWKAYQVYSRKAYMHPRNVRLHQAYAQQSHLQNIYLQRKLIQQTDAQKLQASNQSQPPEAKTAPVTQSQYIPSSPKQTLTYSPSLLSQQQFEQVIDNENHASGQMLMLRAMIAAANADGHIDEAERQQIFQQVDHFDLSNNDKARLFDELRRPLSLPDLVSAVPNPETAIEVYAASLLAIDQQKAAAQDYLNQLASSLSIPTALVNAVHDQAKVQQTTYNMM